jgi:hypothetical protein
MDFDWKPGTSAAPQIKSLYGSKIMAELQALVLGLNP